MEMGFLSAVELATAIRQGKTTAVRAMETVLERIGEMEALYHCYVTVDTETALKKAEDVQKRIEAGELTGSLAGVPVAIKDNLHVAGLPTTCSSRILETYRPAFTAEAGERLEQAGAVVVGKTIMDESQSLR